MVQLRKGWVALSSLIILALTVSACGAYQAPWPTDASGIPLPNPTSGANYDRAIDLLSNWLRDNSGGGKAFDNWFSQFWKQLTVAGAGGAAKAKALYRAAKAFASGGELPVILVVPVLEYENGCLEIGGWVVCPDGTEPNTITLLPEPEALRRAFA